MNTSEALNVPDKSDKTADFDRPLGIIAESPAVVGDKKSENVRQKPTPRYQVIRRIFFQTASIFPATSRSHQGEKDFVQQSE